jgi:hypothetical protein
MLLNIVRLGRRVLLPGLLGLALGGLVGVACDSGNGDCGAVCTRYHDCVDSKKEVASCESQCTTKAESDRDYQDRVVHCRACSEGRACSEVIANCVAPCLGVIP